jgi:hypothetical protein
MDPVLSSLFPIHQIGSDGFNWWVGQVESKKGDDPKNSGRYRVRIVGQHLKSGDITPTDQLPWAQVMLPVTTPFSDGGVTGASVGLNQGNWVIGFYLDNDKQKPIIMGSIGHTAGATEVENKDPNPGSPEKSFTTYTDPKVNPQQNRSLESQDGKDPKTKANVNGGLPAATKSNKPGGAPPILAAALANNTETNPIGGKICNVIANPKCGQDKNLKSGLTRIMGDFFAANQASSGNIGTYYVSKVNGLLYDAEEIARYHIGRVIRLVKSFIARIKGEIIKQLKEAIKKLIDAALLTEDPEGAIIGNTGPLADPEKAFKPIREKGNRLKAVKKIFDEIFKELGCTIEDLTDKIAQWLTDLLLGYLMDAFNNATCLIDSLIDGILNQILSLLDTLVNTVLGPIQELLSFIESPLNLIGSVINKILSLLGISCTGPEEQCEKIQVKCTDCSVESNQDDLDKLIAAIEDGELYSSSGICDEAKKNPKKKKTSVQFIGGIFKDPSPSSSTPSVPTAVTDDESIGKDFLPESDQDLPDEEPIEEVDVPTPTTNNPSPETPNTPLDPVPEIPTSLSTYEVITDKRLYSEGETIKYTINTTNVSDQTVLNYTLSGNNIELSDLNTESLTGTLTIMSNKAEVYIEIANDSTIESSELLTFTLDESGEFADVIITAQFEEIVTEQLPTYKLYADKSVYNEGEDVMITFETTNIIDGTEFNYTIFGSKITPSDFISNTLSGSFQVISNKAKIILGIAEDTNIEDEESFTFVVENTSRFVDLTIKANQKDTGIVEDPVVDVPTYEKPTVNDPVTTDDGEIIDIPIDNPGSPYEKPPTVIITGEGYGATGIALLNNNGFVSEIRLTRNGINYTRNTPKTTNLICIIDSFTLLSPGKKYIEAPEVYVDGNSNVARAIINEDGYVTSVESLDRTISYESIPEIIIIGGGGSGARVIPNLSCLETTELERLGYAKIGTGKYIDCP